MIILYKKNLGGVTMNYHYKKLQGEKVYLSPVAINDADTFVEWMNDFQVTDYTGRSSQLCLEF